VMSTSSSQTNELDGGPVPQKHEDDNAAIKKD
jgi:hypothetical protein